MGATKDIGLWSKNLVGAYCKCVWKQKEAMTQNAMSNIRTNIEAYSEWHNKVSECYKHCLHKFRHTVKGDLILQYALILCGLSSDTLTL